MKIFSLFILFLSSALFADPLVTAITPNCGSKMGGVSVTIIGSGFTGATEVDFGCKILNTSEFTVVNDTTITVPRTPALVPGVVTVAVKVGETASSSNHPYDEFVYLGDWLAYIPYFNNEQHYNVLVYDVELETLLFSIPAQNGGNDVVILPNGINAYSVNSGSNSITIIDCTTNTAVSNYPLPGGNVSFPISMSINAAGNRGITCNFFSGNISILDLTTPTSPQLIRTIPVGSRPTCAVFTIDGQYAYITNDGSENITQLNLATYTTTQIPFPSGSAPSWMIIAPDGLTGYVASNHLLYPVTNLGGSPIVLSGIPGFNFVYPNFYPELVITADGTTLFATNTGDSTVQPVNLSDMTLGTLIQVGATPNGMSLSPDGTYAFVGDGNDNTIAMVHPTAPPAQVVFKNPTNTQNTPTDLAITPDQAPLAYFTATVLSNFQVSFDASLSQAPTGGPLGSYIWDFGDGATLLTKTTSPTITHSYLGPGTYNVQLTVATKAGTSTSRKFTGSLVLQNGGPRAVTSLFVTIPLNPSPPLVDPSIIQTTNKFLLKTCYENQITFGPAGSSSAVLYRIYADSGLTELLATVMASNPTVTLCTPHKHSSYFIIAIDAAGLVSEPLEIKI